MVTPTALTVSPSTLIVARMESLRSISTVVSGSAGASTSTVSMTPPTIVAGSRSKWCVKKTGGPAHEVAVQGELGQLLPLGLAVSAAPHLDLDLPRLEKNEVEIVAERHLDAPTGDTHRLHRQIVTIGQRHVLRPAKGECRFALAPGATAWAQVAQRALQRGATHRPRPLGRSRTRWWRRHRKTNNRPLLRSSPSAPVCWTPRAHALAGRASVASRPLASG